MPASSLATRRASGRLGGLSVAGPDATATARRVVRDRIATSLHLPEDLSPAERERRIEAAVHEHYRELGRRGGAAAAGRPRQRRDTRPRAERLAEARADLLAERIKALVDQAPELTAAQKDRLASLLRPTLTPAP